MAVSERTSGVAGGRDLTAADLIESARSQRFGVRLECPDGDDPHTVATGWFAEKAARPEIYVAAGRMRINRNLTHVIEAKPMLCFGVTLEGRHESIGEALRFVGQRGEFFAASVLEPVRIQTLHRAGETATMASLMIDGDWFGSRADDDLGDAFASCMAGNHLELKRGVASVPLVEAARRILATATESGQLASLRLEAATLDFLASTMEILRERRHRDKAPSAIEIRRMKAVRERLDVVGPEEDLTLEALAREFATSISSLTRHFRVVYGVSISKCLTEARLREAKESLQRGDATIAQAAYLAGYSGPSSFSVAFKRVFGIAPGSLFGSGLMKT